MILVVSEHSLLSFSLYAIVAHLHTAIPLHPKESGLIFLMESKHSLVKIEVERMENITCHHSVEQVTKVVHLPIAKSMGNCYRMKLPSELIQSASQPTAKTNRYFSWQNPCS